jgi:hypothetical protein
VLGWIGTRSAARQELVDWITVGHAWHAYTLVGAARRLAQSF